MSTNNESDNDKLNVNIYDQIRAEVKAEQDKETERRANLNRLREENNDPLRRRLGL